MEYKIESGMTYDEAIKLMKESKAKWWPNSPMYYAHELAIQSLIECKKSREILSDVLKLENEKSEVLNRLMFGDEDTKEG